jgi:transcriptional regulator with XRE-family HTH domain
MGISQSAVARIESGRHWPSRATLQRCAKAKGARPVVRLVPSEAR